MTVRFCPGRRSDKLAPVGPVRAVCRRIRPQQRKCRWCRGRAGVGRASTRGASDSVLKEGGLDESEGGNMALN
jgi:hypothetical protein